jgi:hypothetical protein
MKMIRLAAIHDPVVVIELGLDRLQCARCHVPIDVEQDLPEKSAWLDADELSTRHKYYCFKCKKEVYAEWKEKRRKMKIW